MYDILVLEMDEPIFADPPCDVCEVCYYEDFGHAGDCPLAGVGSTYSTNFIDEEAYPIEDCE